MITRAEIVVSRAIQKNRVRAYAGKAALAGIPAAFMLAISVKSHATSIDTTKFMSQAEEASMRDSDVNDRIDQYVPVMKASTAVNRSTKSLNVQDARQIEKVWNTAYDAGKLQPIPLATYSESVYDGVMGQILRTEITVSDSLNRSALSLAADGKYSAALSDALASMRIGRAIDYSDPLSTCVVGIQRKRDLRLIGTFASRLSPAEKAKVSDQIDQFGVDGPKLEHMLNRMYGLYLNEPSFDGSVKITSNDLPHLGLLRRSHDVLPALTSLSVLQAEIQTRDPIVANDPFINLVSRVLANSKATETLLIDAKASLDGTSKVVAEKAVTVATPSPQVW